MSQVRIVNTVQLGYGTIFDLSNVVQDAGGNIITDDIASVAQLALGDTLYCPNNANLPNNAHVTITEMISTTQFRVNYTGGSGTVAAGNYWFAMDIPINSIKDDDYKIISKPKKLINWSTRENIRGFVPLLSIETFYLSSAEREFLYKLSRQEKVIIYWDASAFSDALIASYEDGVGYWQMLNTDIAFKLLDNTFTSLGTHIEFQWNAIQSVTPTHSGNSTSYSYNANEPNGTKVKLHYNYSGVEVTRLFSVALVQPYDIQIQRHEWEHIDDTQGRLTFGFKGKVFIDFGNFGQMQTESQFIDDLIWLKEFMCAPAKKISVPSIYVIDVVNDFDEVKYDYFGDFIYAKTLRLTFAGKSIQIFQARETNIFTLDDDPLSTLAPPEVAELG